MQTRRQSAIEAITNVIIGYIVSFLSQLLVFPLMNIDVSVSQNLVISCYFIVISISMTYLVRRWSTTHNNDALENDYT